VNVSRSDLPTPRARAAGCTVQRREQERAAHAKKRLRRWERLEQYNKEYRLQEQHRLSPPLAPANSSSDEEKESDGGGPPPIGAIPRPRRHGPRRRPWNWYS
jgi:hypothetical protein